MRTTSLAELPALAGTELGVSDWLELTQDRVNRFADATGDHQWIHVDVERATKELGAPIAHGYLILSLIPFLARNVIAYDGVAHGLNYGLNKVRFANAAPVGKRIRLRLKLLACEKRNGGYLVRNECTIEVEDQQRPACIAETLSLFYPA
jgi:acyl dehydratase